MSRILVVEDDDSLQRLLKIALSGEGHKVAVAPHGAAALELLKGPQPDLILLDMWMPVMDGWQFSKAYRESPGQHAPIVVMTAGPDAARYAKDIGAEGYIGKPFTIDELLDMVKSKANHRPKPRRSPKARGPRATPDERLS